MTNRENFRDNSSGGRREALALIWKYRYSMAVGLLLTLIASLSSLVLPASTQFLVDRVLVGGERHLLPAIVVAAIASTLLHGAATFALSQVVGVSAQRAIANLRREVQQHVTRLPIRFFDSTQTGALVTRIMNDSESIRNLVGGGIVQLVGSAVTAGFALAFLLYYNWQLTIVLLVVLLVYGGGMAAAFVRLRPIFQEQAKLKAEVSGRLTETMGGIRIVKAYHAVAREDRAFTKGVHRLLRSNVRALVGSSATNTFAVVVTGMLGVVIIYIGSHAVHAGSMTLGEMFGYVFFARLMTNPVSEIARIGTEITQAVAGLDRIRELRSVVTETEDDHERSPVGKLRGDAVFRDVSFEYTSGAPVLKGVSFTAPVGSTTALVGSSGSGKSTILSLVMAFNQATQGQVQVDGRDLQDLRLGEYRSQLGVVLQETFLFDGTVADNIRFARSDATRSQIEAAARIAHVDTFVQALPDGYDSVVGERGIKLSGGQRQRIAIARAILADPTILVLDEATSSLDSESEALIQDGMHRLREGRTTFVIAHRLSTIQSADQILVIEGGEVVERGTHAQLMAVNGQYRRLHDRQYAWERERFVNQGEELMVSAS